MKNHKEIVIDENTHVRTLAWPIFIELLLNILLHNVDTIMLGRYSELAVGAVGNANQLLMVFLIMFNVVASATNVIVAQYLGAKQVDKMNQIYTLSFVFNMALGILLSVLVFSFSKVFLGFLKVPAEMMVDSTSYMKIVGACLFMNAGFSVLSQILRCNGYPKMGMYISILVNLFNILGNWLFLYGPLSYLGLGVKGVAISTIFARLIALIVALVLFYRLKIGKLSLKTLHPFPTTLLLKELKIGVPTAGENMAYTLAQLVLFSFVNVMGTDAVNAKVFGNTLMSFSVIFSNSVAMATAIVTGHLVGAGKFDGAYKKVFRQLRICIPVAVVIASINCLICPWTLKLFGANGEVVVLARGILIVGIFMEIGRTTNLIMVNSLKSAGDVMFPVAMGLISMWIVGISVGYVCGVVFGLGVAGVFMGTMADELGRGIVMIARWMSGKWRTKRVIEE